MRKILSLFLALIMTGMCVSCSAPAEKKPITMEPQASQMKAICELAVMECYYHNVAKFMQEDAQGALWWKKDKQFWIEYSGVVKLGVDISLVTIEVNNTQITITLPAAKVLGCKVDSTSLTKDSFIVKKDSAKIEAADEVAAFEVAQRRLEETAASDTALLANAQQRAQALLEDYVTNIGNAVGIEYSLKWVYINAQ
ncbi:MAG: DUF4230 domain-containing protein [Ruminiclostridium sp.]|nr:DUF4230 domain-containing protein [Ruminiclostridium sp.]